jgi:choloylglycine hydrolase
VGFNADKTTPQALRCLLQTVDFPLDGMNAAGLAVSYMTVSVADRGYDRGRMTIGGLDIMRIWLDYARNVDDALALLSDYNLDFGGRPGHYLIADATGNAAVVEFIEGEVKVTREHKPWQAAANFTVFTVEPEKRRSQSYRYLVADQELERNEGNMTMTQAFRLLQEVSQDHGPMPTQWSTVYNISTGEVHVVMNRQYDQIHDFAIKMQGK